MSSDFATPRDSTGYSRIKCSTVLTFSRPEKRKWLRDPSFNQGLGRELQTAQDESIWRSVLDAIEYLCFPKHNGTERKHDKKAELNVNYSDWHTKVSIT